MKALPLVLLLTVTASAQSVKEGKAIKKWDFVAEGPTIKSYYSPGTIRRSGDIIKVWMRFGFPKGSSKVYANTPIDFGEARIYAHMNCVKKEVRAASMLVYDRAGNFYTAETNVQGWTKETPNSISYAVFEYFCERPSKPSNKPPTLRPK